ncbi:MAG TPA: PqqD family peptide modification chaperone [Pyrinomonadaceae bacterium]|nr:PqqD family peptide modification chaperone [Pyrinomonadaceae bacterium]
MKDKKGQQTPFARKDGLVVRELPDEVLVYDLERDKAHCLNQTAAMVWKHCDGQTSVPEMAQLLQKELNAQVDEKFVWFALDQLSKDHLLEERVTMPAAIITSGMNRRQMMRALGIAAVVAVPVVTSIVAPTPAQAATCFAGGTPCTSGAQCCSGSCVGSPGVCAP